MHARHRNAFTLIEILIVVVIIGVAGALVVPSMLSAGTLGLQGAARLIVADVQSAQNEALAAGAQRGIVFDPAGDRYRMVDEDGFTLDLQWMRVGGQPDTVPGDKTGHTVNFATDSRFKGFDLRRNSGNDDDSDAEPVTVVFDELGAPMTASQDVQIFVRYAENSYVVTIDGFTGRVTVR